MSRLRSLRLVALGLALGCGSVALAVSGARTESHPVAGHCPVSGPDGASSEAGCTCVCCPGPGTVSLPHDTGIGLGALPVCRLLAPQHDELQADDLVQSIFHPPRRLAST
jgi:hypothetical protein